MATHTEVPADPPRLRELTDEEQDLIFAMEKRLADEVARGSEMWRRGEVDAVARHWEQHVLAKRAGQEEAAAQHLELYLVARGHAERAGSELLLASEQTRRIDEQVARAVEQRAARARRQGHQRQLEGARAKAAKKKRRKSAAQDKKIAADVKRLVKMRGLGDSAIVAWFKAQAENLGWQGRVPTRARVRAIREALGYSTAQVRKLRASIS